jgi:hypothetical protein
MHVYICDYSVCRVVVKIEPGTMNYVLSKAPFGWAPAPPETALALAYLVKQLLSWS